ncbi:hypothetical protein [Levilactobacillus phage ENFP1]|nr:hypothetical protein [Levilactobacillus phage ENFP1]
MSKITPESISELKALFQDNEKSLGANFSQLIDFFNNNKVTDNGDGTFIVGDTIINVNDLVSTENISIIVNDILGNKLDEKADDSKVVHLDDLLGGSNLLLNSKFDKNLDNWSSWGDSTGGTLGFVAGTDNWDNRATTLLHITKPTASGYFGVAQTGVSVAPNSPYVLSAYRTGSGKLFLQNGNGSADPYSHTKAESVSGIATHKFTTGSTRTTNIYIGMGDGDTGELYVSLTKLEKGVTHSDWSPSPDDITINEDSIGLVNLIYNSQYSNSGDGWKLYPGAYYSDSDISSYNGSLGLGFSKAGNSISAPVAMSKPMPLVGDGTVIPTDVYSARVKAKIYSDSSSDTKFILTIAFLDSTSKRIGYRETFVTPDTSEDWQDVKVLGAGVPTGTSNIQIQFYTQGTLAHGMFVNPMLVKGPVVGPYRPDTIGMADVTVFATKADVTTAISAATSNIPSWTLETSEANAQTASSSDNNLHYTEE